MADKVFCDPIHRHIVFDKTSDCLLLDLIACPEVQRLRRVRQLGVSSYTYHGAEHSRFGHALGTCHLMTEALDALSRNQPELEITEQLRLAARCAALLHDLGHGPFSHLAERVCGFKHGAITRDLILGDTQVNGVLSSEDPGFPDFVASLLRREDTHHHFVTDLLDSHLDVDRMDFLMRDAHYCGVSFGVYDYLRILHTVRVRSFPQLENQQHLVWQTKGEHSVEEFLYARFFMYWTVYYHKTTRGFESLFQSILSKAQELDPGGERAIAPALGSLLRKDVKAKDVARLDDNLVLAQIQAWCDNGDPTLADLSRRFLNREGFKPYGPIAPLRPESFELIEQAKSLLDHEGFDPKYYLLDNTRQTTAYEYYRPEEEMDEKTPQTSITLEDEQGNRYEIAHRLPGVEALGKESDQNIFYYVPREQAARLEPIMSRLLS